PTTPGGARSRSSGSISSSRGTSSRPARGHAGRDPGPLDGTRVARPRAGMRRRDPHHKATTLDVLDHVLDKGVVVEQGGRTPDTRPGISIGAPGVVAADAHVMVPGLDYDPRALAP